MVRFGGKIKSSSGRKGTLHSQVKGRRNVKKKPLLPKKGLNQTSYETGFFDFFKVFWKNNARMELLQLTKQVANAWEALLPKPKLSKKRVLKDYSKELKALQDEAQRQQMERENLERMKKEKSNKKKTEETSDEDAASRTDASSRSNFDDSEASVRSTQNEDQEDDDNESRSNEEADDNESQSENDDTKSYTGEESMSEANTLSRDYSASDVDDNRRNGNEGNNRKRKAKERKYKSYEAYLKAKKCKVETNDEDSYNDERNNDNKHSTPNPNQQDNNSNKKPEDGIFFPMREETSFERIVKNDYNDQNEMMRKLKLFGSTNDIDGPDNDDIKRPDSIDSLASVEMPKLPSQGRDVNSISRTTDTLHVKNLVVGIRQPELQEIFRVFLNEIILIRVLDNKFNGEAIVEFKTVEAAERAWRQMNGVEYKRLPLVLEFADKEDFLL
ncbi:uncharacterized protein DDB_G0283697-like [Harmonia axyridis]|uniref:uncharacterized protein DDB_G0283697-like n=1 Tax=Harmonia axyridis TaxID=115357 RepID=UPI001E27565C|nr:uncharacterized protein DDB_G0283697-like [Harmonia axyridis]